MPPFPNIQNDRPVADQKQGIHHKPERLRVHHAGVRKVGKGQAVRAGEQVPGCHEQRVVMGCNTPQECIGKLQAAITEPVGGPPIQILFGR